MLIDTTGSNAGLAMLLEAFRGKFALAGRAEDPDPSDGEAVGAKHLPQKSQASPEGEQTRNAVTVQESDAATALQLTRLSLSSFPEEVVAC